MRVTTWAEERDFGSQFLEDVLAWIASEFEPEDVFDDQSLAEWAADWAEENGWTEEE